jgi:hypothetical protein
VSVEPNDYQLRDEKHRGPHLRKIREKNWNCEFGLAAEGGEFFVRSWAIVALKRANQLRHKGSRLLVGRQTVTSTPSKGHSLKRCVVAGTGKRSFKIVKWGPAQKVISHKHKFIFVHVKSTAGSSVEALFGIGPVFANPEQPDDKRHRKLGEYKQLFPQAFDEYFKFVFVRNPWDRMVSRYFRIRGARRLAALDEAIVAAGLIADPRERNRTLAKLERKRARKSNKYGPFSEWITALRNKRKNQLPEGAERYFDFVGRFETLHKDFETIGKRIGLRKSLPHVNRSKHAHYTDYYDEETKAIVANMCAYDIALFGYRFGD